MKRHQEVETRTLILARSHRGRDTQEAAIFGLPVLTERLCLLTANRAALGWQDGDTTTPSGEPNGDDTGEVLCATVALCLRGSLDGVDGFPSFRAHKRDVVAYGGVVQTILWKAGYRDPESISKVGSELLTWISDDTFDEEDAIAAEVEVFPATPG